MAAVTLVFTDNGDGTMQITSSDTAGMNSKVPITRDPAIGGYSDAWKRGVIDFVLGTLYAGKGE